MSDAQLFYLAYGLLAVAHVVLFVLCVSQLVIQLRLIKAKWVFERYVIRGAPTPNNAKRGGKNTSESDEAESQPARSPPAVSRAITPGLNYHGLPSASPFAPAAPSTGASNEQSVSVPGPDDAEPLNNNPLFGLPLALAPAHSQMPVVEESATPPPSANGSAPPLTALNEPATSWQSFYATSVPMHSSISLTLTDSAAPNRPKPAGLSAVPVRTESGLSEDGKSAVEMSYSEVARSSISVTVASAPTAHLAIGAPPKAPFDSPRVRMPPKLTVVPDEADPIASRPVGPGTPALSPTSKQSLIRVMSSTPRGSNKPQPALVAPPVVGAIQFHFHRACLYAQVLQLVTFIDFCGTFGIYSANAVFSLQAAITPALCYISGHAVYDFARVHYGSLMLPLPGYTKWLVSLVVAVFWLQAAVFVVARALSMALWMEGAAFCFVVGCEVTLLGLFNTHVGLLARRIHKLQVRGSSLTRPASPHSSVVEGPTSFSSVLRRMLVLAVCISAVVLCAIAYQVSQIVKDFQDLSAEVEPVHPDRLDTALNPIVISVLQALFVMSILWYSSYPLDFLWKQFVPRSPAVARTPSEKRLNYRT